MLELQGLAVASIVSASAVYAAWTLLPFAARRACASALLRLPLPVRLAAPLRALSSRKTGACGCDGCDKAVPPSAAPSAKVVHFHPRPPR